MVDARHPLVQVDDSLSMLMSQSLALRATGWLTKSFDAEKLVALVKKLAPGSERPRRSHLVGY